MPRYANLLAALLSFLGSLAAHSDVWVIVQKSGHDNAVSVG